MNKLKKMFEQLPKRFQFAIIGFILSIGAPLGWAVFSSQLDIGVSGREISFYIYVYLFSSTAVVFSTFGFTMGYLYERVERLSEIDPLTKLFNVATFQIICQKLLDFCRRYEKPASLVMIDIDYFKSINDTYGHAHGSEVIFQIAEVIKSVARQSDIPCRFGGDEFAVFMPETSGKNALEFCRRLQIEMGQKDFSPSGNKEEKRITLSMGVSHTHQQKVSLKELVSQADLALYQSKEKGRDCATEFEV